MRRELNAGLALVVGIASALLISSCATQPPPTPTPTPSESVSTLTPTPTPSPTPTPTPTPTQTPTLTPTPSSAPTRADAVLLAGDGIAGQRFGTAESKAAKAISDVLGRPDEAVEGILCELSGSSPWQRSIIYDGLSVLFIAESASKSAPRTLNGWSLGLEGSRPAIQMQDDVPLNLSFAQLEARYPDGKLEETGLGDDSQIFTLKNGIRFIGVEFPDLVMGGEVHYCE